MSARPLVEALRRLGAGHHLSRDEVASAVGAIMEGRAQEAEIAAFLTGLHVLGEGPDELIGVVQAVRDRMTPFDFDPALRPVLDTCGTGGDGASTVNISTGTAIVVAACGVPVVKHGNRSASGNSGSAEVLAELGVAIEAEVSVARRCLEELGITFLFAPKFHAALRFAAPVRRQLPFRTIFNLVGPLANPARPDYQLVGSACAATCEPLAVALADFGVRRAAVVTGGDGLDEVTLSGPTHVFWLGDNRIERLEWDPSQFGLPVVRAREVEVSGPAASAVMLRMVFAAEPVPARDVVLANASAALLVAGRVTSLPEGVASAAEAIDRGAASNLLLRWAELSHRPV